MKPKNAVLLFLFCRLTLLVSLPEDGLRGFGDLSHFFDLAGLGLPWIDLWVEFPPVFPYLSRGLYLLANGREHIYDYLLVSLFSLAQAGSIWIFIKLARKRDAPGGSQVREWVYLLVTLCLPYGWWYFDPLVVWMTLAGLAFVFEGKVISAGILLALGALTKFFPILALPAIWRWSYPRRNITVSVLVIGITSIVLLGFLAGSPAMAVASLRSQTAKGSWETIWALVDGNFQTGNFGQLSERYDPSAALRPRGNPPRIPSWLTLIPFGVIGGFCFWKARLQTPFQVIAFFGLTWCLFLIWSPGYSPQWVLYLLPLVLLSLPEKEAVLFTFLLILINLLEWPIMLSRGYNWGLWLTIPVRTLILVLLSNEFWRVIQPHHRIREAS
jgi:hypothetical protein